MKKNFLVVFMVLLVLTGCGGSTDAVVDNGANTAEEGATDDGFIDSVVESKATGNIEIKDEDILVLKGEDTYGALDSPLKKTLTGTGIDFEYEINDSDEDGKLSDGEDYTYTMKITNNTSGDIVVQSFMYAQENWDEYDDGKITFEIETGSMDKEKFVQGEESYEEGYINYEDEDTYNTFTFPQGETISIKSTQSSGDSYENTLATSTVHLTYVGSDDETYTVTDSIAVPSKSSN